MSTLHWAGTVDATNVLQTVVDTCLNLCRLRRTMDFHRHVSEFESTRHATSALQRLLFCCQCSQLAKNVCTFGNCEHFFCKQCVEERLGGCCPVCGMPAHAKDAQVNRQLSNIVSLSLALSRLLETQPDTSPSGKSDDQTDLVLTNTTTVCHLPKEPGLQDTASSSTEPESSEKHSSIVQQPHTSTSKCPAEEENPMCLPQKMSTRISKMIHQTTLTQLCDDFETGEIAVKSRSKTRKICTPQTRTRGKQLNGTSISKESLNTARKDEDQNAMAQFSAEGRDMCSSTESVKLNTDPEVLVPKSTTGTLQKSGRQKQKNKGVKEKKIEASTNFRTSASSPSARRRLSSRRKEISSTLSPSHSIGVSSSSKSVTRSRSTSAIPALQAAQGDKAMPHAHSRRKSMPSAPSDHKKRESPASGASPAAKTSNRTAGRGSTGRVKRNAKGETPLHVAVIKGDLPAVKELLSRGDNPNVRDNAGWTPLHEAVNHGHTAVAELLLQHGAMVNMPGMDNDTPLHDAVVNHRLDCARLLVAYGASVSARNVRGKTALELAMTQEVKDALQQPILQQPVISRLSEPEDAEEFLPLCFLGTALSRDQQRLLQKCGTRLHGKVVQDYCPEVTHVVSSVNPDGQCPRTMKYLQGILGGKWIVSIDWASVCLEYGEKVSEEPFEIPGSSTHPNSTAAHNGRINRKLQLPRLFDGCQVHLHGSFTRLPPTKQELVDLLQLGGAHLLMREPHLTCLDEYDVTVPYHAAPGTSLVDCGIFIVHDGGAKAPVVEAHRMRAVPAAWIIECIATFSLVEPSSLS